MLDNIIKKNIFFGLLIRGGAMFISYMLVPIVLSYLGKEKYGIWAVVLSITQWFVFFDFGMGHGLRNKLTESIAQKDFVNGSKYISTTYFVSSIVFTGLYVVFFIVSFFLNWSKILNLPINFDENILLFVQVIFGLIFLRFIFQLLKSIFFAFQMPAMSSLLDIVSLVFILFGIVHLVENNSSSIFKVGVIYTSIPLVVLFASTFLFFIFSKDLTFSYKLIDLKLARPLLKLGSGFLLLQLSALFLKSATIFLINYYMGPEKSAEYSIAVKYISILMIISTIFFVPYWSAVTDAYNKGNYEWIRKVLKKNMIIASILSISCLLLSLFSPIFFDMWIKDTNIPFNVTLWAAIYTGVFIFTQPIITFINGTGKIKQQTLFSITIILFIVPIEVTLFKYTSFEIEAFIVPVILFRLIRSIYGWVQLKQILTIKNI